MIIFWHTANLEKFLDTLLIKEKGEDKPCGRLEARAQPWFLTTGQRLKYNI